MSRRSVRRLRVGALRVAAAGLGLGFVAGFALRSLVGEVDRVRLRALVRGLRSKLAPAPSPRSVADHIEDTLGRDPEFASLGLEVVPAGRGQVELHGWVPSRAAGARAVRVATAAAPSLTVTSRLLVRGEDDAGPEPPPSEERRPA